MMSEANLLIKELLLEPHPEGGYYRRTFESAEIIQTDNGLRPAVTCIYYLLGKGDYSRWHRLKSTERWFHHRGAGINIHTLNKESGIQTHLLGPRESGYSPTVDISANTWFCAEIENNADYALVSCMVCPGFDFEDFELANPSFLKNTFPKFETFINKFL